MSIIDLFNSLTPQLRAWASVWIADGAYEGPPYEDEPSLVTAKLRAFRLAYNRASAEDVDNLHRFI